MEAGKSKVKVAVDLVSSETPNLLVLLDTKSIGLTSEVVASASLRGRRAKVQIST